MIYKINKTIFKSILLFSLFITIFSCSQSDDLKIDDLKTEIIPNDDSKDDSEIETTPNFQGAKKVLFVGNSYTAANNTPELVKQLALSVGDTLIYTAHTPGGAYTSQHATSTAIEKKINSKKWDYVTIQTQSQESALSKTYFNTNVYPYAVTLVNKIKANYSGSMPLFFMTWGYENGVSSRCAEL
ncbi:MAG: DUF4886 domain-containing protein, partial [Polaribacter sp.]